MKLGLTCDECGNKSLVAMVHEGQQVYECELCGALQGDDQVVGRLEMEREAREFGFDPLVYPLVKALGRVAGLRVVRASAGQIEQRIWPFVHMQVADSAKVLQGLENLSKSLALGATGSGGLHWVVEVEYQARLTFTLKPRFHRNTEAIDAGLVRQAQLDLARLCANLERDSHLSWWRA